MTQDKDNIRYNRKITNKKCICSKGIYCKNHKVNNLLQMHLSPESRISADRNDTDLMLLAEGVVFFSKSCICDYGIQFVHRSVGHK